MYWTCTEARWICPEKTKKSKKGMGKLPDFMIDKLQNYYGIAIRSNIGSLQGMKKLFMLVCFTVLHQRKGIYMTIVLRALIAGVAITRTLQTRQSTTSQVPVFLFPSLMSLNPFTLGSVMMSYWKGALMAKHKTKMSP
jgi:hypothetical protein